MPTSNFANDSFTTATQLTGVTNSAQGAVDQLLTSTNLLDFYRFKISGSSTNLRLNVTGIKGDVKLSLFKASSETTPDINPIAIPLRAENTGTISESYNSTSDPTALAGLAAGTYYIKIERSGLVPVDSTYSLDVFASSTQKTVSALWSNPAGGLDVWQTTGSGIDAKGQYTAIDTPSNFQLIGTADIDGDGIDDILWKDTVKNQFFVWFMENGTVRRDNLNVYLKDSTGQALAPKDSNWKIVGIDDIDKDGSTDFLLRNQVTGEMNAWFMKGEILVNDVSLTTNGLRLYSDWQISGFSNGRILWRNINSNAVTTWDIDRSGVKLGQVVTPTPISQDWKVIAFRDFNNDGIADILWRNSQTETIAFWKMKNTFETPPEYVSYQVSNNFRIAAIADFTGDGRPDIFFWNGKSKQVDPTNGGVMSLWEFLGDGLSIKGTYIKQATPDPNVFNTLNIQYEGSSAELVKDFDGDGKADILWRDQTSGATVIWKMNGDILVGTSNALGDLPPPIAMPGIQYDGFRTTASLNATTKKRDQFTAGLSVPNAFNLGVLDGSGSFIDKIGGGGTTDRSDWYKFTVETASLLTGINTTPGVITKVYAQRPNITPTTVNDLTLVSDAGLIDVFQPNTYYINVVFPQGYTTPGTPLPYTLNLTGRLGITNLSLANSTIALDKSSLSLDVNSANNQVTIQAYQLENTGDFAASNVTVAYYLSKDGILDAGDRLLTPGNLASAVGTVAKGTAEKVTNGVVTTPGVSTKASVGQIVLNLPGKNDPYWSGQNGSNYQIIAVVNPENPTRAVVNEKNFDDNAKASTAITITGLGNPDLTGGGLTRNTATISNTDLATGTFTIQNVGGVTSANETVSFYFSTDANIDSNIDLFLGNVPLSAIAGNGSVPGSYSFSLFDRNNPGSVQYWSSQGPVGTTISGFIGMIIDPEHIALDANPSNNQNQGLNKDLVAINVKIAANA
jgi:hypothetical protein